MKPIKLIIDGINSFAEKQEVNFELLAEKGIFGIFGQTGSGKSTILDCIFLALYGKIIRTKQPAEFINLGRSDAKVTLTFSSRNEKNEACIYEAVRTYKIDRAAQTLKTESSAQLYEILQDGKKNKLAQGDDETTQKCTEIIGFGADEFKRCIALPQGEYAKLLKDSGYEKIKVFSKIFDLEKYGEKLFNNLTERARNKEKRLAYLEGAINEMGEISRNEIEFNKKELERIILDRDIACKKAGLARKVLLEKEKENIIAAEVFALNEKLAGLNRRSEELERKTKKLNIMKISHKIAPSLQYYEGIFAECAVAESKLKACDEDLIENSNALAQITAGGEKDRTAGLLKLTQIEARKKLLELGIAANHRARQLSVRADKLLKLKKEAEDQLDAQSKNNSAALEDLETAVKELTQAGQMLTAIAGSKKGATEEVVKTQNILAAFTQNNHKNQQNTARKNQQLQIEISEIAAETEQLRNELEQAKNNIAEFYGSHITAHEAQARAASEYAKIKINAQTYLAERARQKSNERQSAEFAGAVLEAEQQLANYAAAIEGLAKDHEALQTKYDKALFTRENYFGKNIVNFLRNEQQSGAECPVCSQVVFNKPAAEAQVSLREYDFEMENITHRITELLADKEEMIAKHSRTKQDILFIKAEIKRLKDENLKIQNTLSLLEKEHAEFAGASEEKINKVVQLSAAACESLAGLVSTVTHAETLLADKTKVLIKKQTELDAGELIINNLKKEAEWSAAIIAENDVFMRSSAHANEIEILNHEIDTAKLTKMLLECLQNKENAAGNYMLALSQVKALTAQIEYILEEQKENEQKAAAIAVKTTFADELRELAAQEKQIKEHLSTLAQNENELIKQETRLKMQKASLLATHAFKQNELKQIEDEVNSMLALGGCTRSEIISSIDIEDITKLEQEVLTYEAERTKVLAAIERLNKVLKEHGSRNKTSEVLMAELTAAENEHIALVRKAEWMTEKISAAQKLQEKSKYLFAQQQQAVSELNNIRELTEAIRGSKLLKFVAEEYLINICHKANDIFALLTNGRYQFAYDDDFKICDNLSGGIVRGVNTLSGGETFLASISLAIAITEFAASFRSRASEFMFLDEGFGTLDKESLETVMIALRRLQNESFAIGIISHEDVVKNKVPRKIEIEKPTAVTGSMVKMVL